MTAAPAPAVQPAGPPASAQQQALVIKPPVLEQTTGNSFTDCSGCPEMIKLPGGRFEMGSREDGTELPVHEVTVAAFALGKYPVTLAEWRKCVAAKACLVSPEGDDQIPVYGISWYDAQDYVKWLSQASGAQYRLPSEAEWEYAARANTRTKFYWGDTLQPSKSACKGCGTEFRTNRPMKVGALPPNPFGLHDLNGTVSQWVADCWHKDYRGAPRDGVPWVNKENERDCGQRVIRGGAWNNDVSYLRSSSRDFYDATVRYETHGLRVARTLPH
jgi:formylglycine-generating enzyme required for sulfatase activity